MKLKEAISQQAIDDALAVHRNPVQGKIKGDIGKYAITLEMIIDMLAETSPKGDAEFRAAVNQIIRNVNRIAPGGKTRQPASKQPASKQPASKQVKQQTPGDDRMPSLASLVQREKGPEKSNLKKPDNYEPYKRQEPEQDPWKDWMKKNEPEYHDWEPAKLAGKDLPPLKKSKAQKDYELDRKLSKQKRPKKGQFKW
jgi:hypothetical protein